MLVYCCEGNICGLGSHVHILNIYAPYRDRYIFWDRLISSRMLELDSLIIVGDINCTIRLDEVWGRYKKIDPLARMIQDVILMHNFVDICPVKITPTWDNSVLTRHILLRDWIIF